VRAEIRIVSQATVLVVVRADVKDLSTLLAVLALLVAFRARIGRAGGFLTLPLQHGTEAVLQGGDGAGAIGGTAGSAATGTGTAHNSKCPGFWKRETGHWAIAGIGFVAKRSEVRLPAYWP